MSDDDITRRDRRPRRIRSRTDHTAPMGHPVLRLPAPHEVDEETTDVHNRTKRLSELAVEMRAIDTRLGTRLATVESDVGDIKMTVAGIERSTDWQNSTLRDQSRVLSELSAGAIKNEASRTATEREDKTSKRKLGREVVAFVIAIALAVFELVMRLAER